MNRLRDTIERTPLWAIILALVLLVAWINLGCVAVGQRNAVERPTLQEARAVAAQQVVVTRLATACRDGDKNACARLVVEDRVLMRLLEIGQQNAGR